MLSVGIMSMQRIRNYGSSLQAFALRRLIEGVEPDATVSFVDFEPGTPLIDSEETPAHSRGRIGMAWSKLRQYGEVDARLRDKFRFFNHKRSYAAHYFPLMGVPRERNHNLELDVQVIGSDEVFNCVQRNPNVGYARDLFGHGSPARRIASYAASFGNTTLGKIDAAGIRAQLEVDLARFAAVSVRDRNSAQVVQELTGRTPEIHLDPTLVFDFDAIEFQIPKVPQRAGKYVIVYGYSGRFSAEECVKVREYAQRIGARVVAIGGLQACADEFIDPNPFALLAHFRDAAAVITDTFHGTIFSIINEVPFATLIRTSSGHSYGNEEKLHHLLEMLQLSDRAIPPDGDLGALLGDPIDFAEVRSIRAREQARTMDYLSKVLEVPAEGETR